MISAEMAPPTPSAIENTDPNRGLGFMNWLRNTRPGQLLANVSMSAAVILPGGTAVGVALAEAPPAMAADTEATLTDSQKQECTNIALAEPKIVKAEVLHAGQYKPDPKQRFFLSTRYEPWTACKGSFARGNRAKAQAFHDGHWQDVTPWGSVNIIRETDAGNWFDLGDEKNVDFPICNARILLKAGIVDLSVDMNTNTPWKPHHPSIARKAFPPIPAKLLPHKPKVC